MPIMKRFVALVALSVAGLGRAKASQDQVVLPDPFVPDGYVCTHPPSKQYVFSREPLVVYLENFITPEERLHLRALAEPNFKSSTVLNADGTSSVHPIRTSQSTSVYKDAIVTCIGDRALAFQGFTPDSHIETIQLVKYAETQHYNFHTDWFADEQHRTASVGGNRISSIFGYIRADNVTGGGTNFPALEAPRDERWCRFVDCDEPYEKGVSFRPIEGNAVFWGNLFGDGSGDVRTLHAGLPVVTGQKIGMNIWTRQGPA